MGTNYYARVDICPSCGRCNELHIGKSSGGWTFSFHALNEWECEQFGLAGVRSYKGWLELLTHENVKIFDEYDRQVTIEDFKALVQAKISERRNPSIEAKKEGWHGCFLDDEGHSFSEREFS